MKGTNMKLGKMSKVNDSTTVYRYDNGWMLEMGGRDNKGDYKNLKVICNTEEDLFETIKEWNTKELD